MWIVYTVGIITCIYYLFKWIGKGMVFIGNKANRKVNQLSFPLPGKHTEEDIIRYIHSQSDESIHDQYREYLFSHYELPETVKTALGEKDMEFGEKRAREYEELIGI